MTRINCGIPPAELTDKHLLAEHREIKRIPNMINKGRANLENIPEKFTLGKGHVRFFYDKLLYLHNRYEQIRDECLRRGFNVTDYAEAFMVEPENEHLIRDYTPTKEDIQLVRKRIRDRLNGIK